MSEGFIHLHLHSEYAIDDSIIRLDALLAKAQQNEMSAVAITDPCNLFAMVKFYRDAIASGIKPIIGAEIYIHNPVAPEQYFNLILLCQDSIGYKNLTQLISKAHLEGQAHGKPRVSSDWLKKYSAGLIALSGKNSELGQNLLKNKIEQAKIILSEYQQIFPNRFYIELQRIGAREENHYLEKAVRLASEFGIPVVATNSACFISPEDFEAHDARVCINQGWVLNDPKRPQLHTPQQYFKSADEMQVLFQDIPEAILNTIQIAKRCNLMLNLGGSYLPEFPVPEGDSITEYLEREAREGLEKRLDGATVTLPEVAKNLRKPYDDRLTQELAVINSMGFAGYFLIVADFIKWAKSQDIPVGPGRGSGAGSLVAYSLGITDLDPLKYDLLFERFLNPERISMPDFDIDFCMDGRDRVIDYVSQKYGRGSVSQIITYGTMAAKAVVRDVGRVLGHPYGFVDKLAKLIPFELGITLDKALEEPLLKARYEAEEEVRHLFDLAKKLEGITRNVGKHAGGVVISPSLLTDFTPLYCEPSGENLVTQFDKDDIETIGLVKFDFLGLRTLTIIHRAVKLIREANPDLVLDINQIVLDDKITFDLLKSCRTTAVFQLESRGMKDLIKRIQPDCFEDIIALVALFRPGPLQSGMVDDFIDRKHGKAKIEYFHPSLELILKPTYGVILYQEQVMQIAQTLAGYSLGAADLLRRAMGKKKAEEMAEQRAVFLSGATGQNINAVLAGHIFDLMEKFAGYGFNKSHSAAYALLAYQTAWLKAHYPAEFMAAVLSSDMDHTDKVVIFIEECRLLKLPILPPDINQSSYYFTVTSELERDKTSKNDNRAADVRHCERFSAKQSIELARDCFEQESLAMTASLAPSKSILFKKNKNIIYGLGAIKGVGEAAIENVMLARKEGEFKDLFDFCRRVDLHKVNRRALEALIKSGAMDKLGPHRKTMLDSLNHAIKAAEQHNYNQTAGQMDLFAEISEASGESFAEFIQSESWAMQEQLSAEKETLGFYLSGHPINAYQEELAKLTTHKISEVDITRNQSLRLAGLIINLRTIQTKRGDRMAFLTLDDQSGRMEIVIFSDIYDANLNNLQKDKLIILEAEISTDKYTGLCRATAQKIFSIDQAREYYGKYLQITLDSNITPELIQKLSQMLSTQKKGKTPIIIKYQREDSVMTLPLGEAWKIYPSDELLLSLQKTIPMGKIEMEY